MPIKSFDCLSYKGIYKYDVVEDLYKLLEIINEQKYSVIFIDKKISTYYSDFVCSLTSNKILVEVSSNTKSVEKLIEYLEILSNLSLKRNSSLLIIGGATMQDIFATVSCIYFRGINWNFIPTTLLSQGDSCIGSKTSLDGFGKKNQFGVFYPPRKIFVCSEFLKSLPKKEIYSGIGDILHYLVPYEESIQVLKNLIKLHREKIKDALLSYCVDMSSMAMKIKSELVKIDEFDQGPRKIFNFGHTFGHAIEKSSKSYVPHGIAVLCGLYIALNLNIPNSISSICKYQADLIKELLEIAILDEKLNIEIQISKLKTLLDADKKNLYPGKVRVILPTLISKSLWKSRDFIPQYGLKYSDINLNECVDSFYCLNRIKGINFYRG